MPIQGDSYLLEGHLHAKPREGLPVYVYSLSKDLPGARQVLAYAQIAYAFAFTTFTIVS